MPIAFMDSMTSTNIIRRPGVLGDKLEEFINTKIGSRLYDVTIHRKPQGGKEEEQTRRHKIPPVRQAPSYNNYLGGKAAPLCI